jgi:hypothetical protein
MNERLDHLGIVAGVCQEIGLAAHELRNEMRRADETAEWVSVKKSDRDWSNPIRLA